MTTKKIYQYCAQDWKNVERILSILIDKKATIVQTGGEVANRLYRYLETIYKAVILANSSPDLMTNQNIVKFLDIQVAQKFIDNPSDKENRDVFSEQIVWIYAATGQSLSLSTYDREELASINKGDLDYYDDLMFIKTLRELIDKKDDVNRVTAVSEFLYKDGGREMQEPVDWQTAFLHMLILQAVWNNFSILSAEKQELILQNYLYLGLVAGAPVQEVLENYLTIDADKQDERLSLVGKSLDESHEFIPLNLEINEERRLSDLVKNYFVQLAGNKPSGFAQEQFINGFYQGDRQANVYRSWLRQLLSFAAYLNKL